MRTGEQGRRQRGSVLVPAMLVMIALAGMAAAIITTSLHRQNASRALHETERAYLGARTGLDLAIFEMDQALDTAADGIGVALGQLNGTSHSVRIEPNFTGPGTYTLRSVGAYGPNRVAIEMIVSTEAKFPFGMFGRTELAMGGSFSSDSYDSTGGTYADQFDGDHAREGAKMGSNGIIYAGGGSIYGDVTPGPLGQVLGDLSNITGSTAPAPKPYEFGTPTYAPPIASSGVLTGESTLTDGEYRFTNLLLGGGDVLTLDGDITLYIDSSIKIRGRATIVVTPGSTVTINHGSGPVSLGGGGIVNSSQQPSALTLLSSSTGSFNMFGSADFFGLVYAPEVAYLSTGDAALYGVVVADTVTLKGGGMLHFDESLLIPDGGDRRFGVNLARRISPVGL